MAIFEIINLLSFAFQTTALLLIAVALLHLRKEARNKHEWDRRVHTLAAIKLSSTSQEVIGYVLGKENEELLYNKKQKISDEKISLMLNELEQICIGIKQGVYDEQIVSNSLGRTFVSVFHTLKRFIIDRRSAYASETFIEFESIVRKWESELGKSEWDRRSVL